MWLSQESFDFKLIIELVHPVRIKPGEQPAAERSGHDLGPGRSGHAASHKPAPQSGVHHFLERNPLCF